MNDRPVLRREQAPDHRPGFWEELDVARTDSGATTVTSTMPAQPAPQIDAASASSSRSLWPLVAAAAVLAVFGLGLLFVRGGAEPGTELVSGGDTADADSSFADAPGSDAEGNNAEEADAEGNRTGEAVEGEAASIPVPTAVADETTTPATGGESGDAGEPATQPIDLDDLDVPTYVAAAGNRDSLMFPPANPFADGTRFLATWEQQQVSWFSLADIEADCTRPDHSTLRYVTSDGFDFAASDPEIRFPGNASNFAFTDQHLAWVAECDGRLALYVASQSGVPGQMFGPRMAWIGRGSDTAALVSWSGSAVQLSSVDDNGEPFFVEVDLQSRIVSGSAVRSDVGPGTGRDSWIVGAAPDGATTWWNATQATGATTCDGATLSRHTEVGGWDSPFVDAVDVGAVRAFALNPELSMVAFSDACPGINEGRFFIGTLRADGLISSVRTIDLSAFASGPVFILDWTDALTLRIHTDESVTGGFPLRFEYVFDDGRDAGVLVLLD